MQSREAVGMQAELSTVLRSWRTRTLNIVAVVLAVVAIPAIVASLVPVYGTPYFNFWLLIYGGAYLIILALALLRRLDSRIRGWVLLSLGYFMGVLALWQGGLWASGRLYLFFLPIVALVLIDLRSGLVMAGISLLTFALLPYVLEIQQLVPAPTSIWLGAVATFAMLLAAVMALLQSFYRFLLSTLEAERQAKGKLALANARLEEYSRTLEQKVAQRTQALTEANQQLQQYTQDLEAQNAELDAFAHTVAHDLKSPLTSLVGFSTLLEQRYARMEPEQIDQSVRVIAQNGRRMTNIIDELLLLASVRKVEEVEIRPVEMAPVVAEAQARLVTLIEAQEARIVVPERWPLALGYAPWVEEVWTNYISNAIKYGGAPEREILPRVELGYERVSGNGHVRFWVRDNGPGLSAAEQERLFAEFPRLHQVRAEGHGLGLSIVQRIVTKLGGEVGVESTPGEGSTFWFTLPADEAAG